MIGEPFAEPGVKLTVTREGPAVACTPVGAAGLVPAAPADGASGSPARSATTPVNQKILVRRLPMLFPPCIEGVTVQAPRAPR